MPDGDSGAAVTAKIGEITAEAEIGRVYNGSVQKIMDYGAFVEDLPGTGVLSFDGPDWVQYSMASFEGIFRNRL